MVPPKAIDWRKWLEETLGTFEISFEFYRLELIHRRNDGEIFIIVKKFQRILLLVPNFPVDKHQQLFEQTSSAFYELAQDEFLEQHTRLFCSWLNKGKQ